MSCEKPYTLVNHYKVFEYKSGKHAEMVSSVDWGTILFYFPQTQQNVLRALNKLSLKTKQATNHIILYR